MSTQQDMIRTIRERYGLNDQAVLQVLELVPRDEFVPQDLKYLAYEDQALSIGFDQTISQPYTVAYMTHLLALTPTEEVLEIGTGSGYQAAVLSRLAKKIFSIERIPELAKRAKERLKKLGFDNVVIRAADGEKGWKKGKEFDAIIVTAAISGEIPKPLLEQLKEGGVLVAPVGKDDQQLFRITKRHGKLKKEKFGVFQFVPFVKD